MTQINNKKRTYVKPSMKAYPLNTQLQLLAGSSIPVYPGEDPTGDQW